MFVLVYAFDLAAVPANDKCANALPIVAGFYEGETCSASRDGSSSCASNADAGDVWFTYTPSIDETITATTFASNYDSLLSVHTGCPGTTANQIACSDDCGNQGACVTFPAAVGKTYWIRVSGFQNNAGRFHLSLARDSAIGGHVTDSTTGNGLNGVQVLVYIKETLEFVKMLNTDNTGAYIADGLSPGNYIVRTLNNNAFVDELYNNRYCEGVTCNPFIATVVNVQAGEFHAGVDFALDPGGRVSGTVTDAVTGLPVPSVEVHVHDPSNNHITLGFTDEAGHYDAFDGLPPGNYIVLAFNHARYVDELHDQVPCPGASCTPAGATQVAITLGVTTSINFALNPGGIIGGTITDSVSGNPVAGVQVIVYDSSGRRVTTGSTDAAGVYKVFDGLPTGNYFVRTSNSRSYVDELNPEIPCMAGLCQVTGGTTVPVTVGQESQLDFQLDPGAVISGAVQSAGSTAPLQGILLDILDSTNRHLRYEFTDTQGKYSTHIGLTTGNYFIKSLNQTGFIDEIYDNVPCIASRCDVSQGTPLPASPGNQIPNVNFGLDTGGTISGKVTEAATGLPLENVFVYLATQAGAILTFGVSNSCGDYTTFHGVPENDYIFRTSNNHDLLDEAYDDHLCLDGICSILTADPVHVLPNTHGIDFSLSREILLRDEFDDGVLNWVTSGGTWSEANGELSVVSTSGKATAMAPLPWDPSGQQGCVGCTIVFRVQNSGKASLLAWYINKGNHVELQMNSGIGRWHLKQFAGGKVVGHARSRHAMDPGVYYEVKLRFDGRKFTLFIDGEIALTLTATGSLSGNLGFGLKTGAANFDSILVY